jgi:hypothetical protein
MLVHISAYLVEIEFIALFMYATNKNLLQ